MKCQNFNHLQIFVDKFCYGEWMDCSFNLRQFRDESELVIRYFKTTGSVDFQGKPGGYASERKFILETLLSNFKDADSLDDVLVNETIIRATEFYRKNIGFF